MRIGLTLLTTVGMATLLSPACPIAPELPPGAQLSCASQEDCPANTECRSTIGRCVPIGADAEPPGLTAPLVATPALARAGVEVVATFTVDKGLGATPKLALIFGGGGTETLDVNESGELGFEARFTVPTDASEGLVSALLELVDDNGNPARIERPGLFRVDLTPPAVVLAQPDAEAYALGAQPVLRLDLSEPVDPAATTLSVVQVDASGGETVRDDLFAVPVVASQGTALIYVAANPLVATDHGGYRLSLTTTDIAGNVLESLPIVCGAASAAACFSVDALVPTASLAAHRGGVAADEPGAERVGVVAPFNDLVIDLTLGADSVDEALTFAVAIGGEDISASCVATTDLRRFTCTRTLTAAETDGSRTISVSVADAAGNRGGAEATVFVDATGPRPLGNAQLGRDDGNLRAQASVSRVLLNRVSFVDADAPPPALTLTLYLDEPYALATAAVVVVLADGSERAFAIDDTANVSAGLVRATYAQQLDEPDQEATVRVRATDLLGNTREADVATVVFDNTAPAFANDYLSTGVVHERRPWGDAASPASDYRLVFTAAVEPEATVLAWSDGNLDVAQPLGDLHADDAGALVDLPLIDVDLPEVWLTLRDRAGNSSDVAALVTRQRWTGALRRDVALPPNPHEAWSTTRVAANAIEPVRPYRRTLDDAERTQLSTGSLTPADAVAVLAAPVDDWVNAYSEPALSTYGMNSGWFDPSADAPRWLSGRDVWELQGDRLLRVVEDDPEDDGRPTTRQVPAVGRSRGGGAPQVAFFGGQQDVGPQTPVCESGLAPFFEDCFLNDVWIFNGTSWENIVQSATWTPGLSPAPRSGAAIGLDPVRDRWVLFGGIAPGGAAAQDCRDLRIAEVVDLSNTNGVNFCNDLWELDASDGTWTRIAFDEAKWPFERDGHAIEWDPAEQELLLFGGYRRSTGTPCQADEEESGDSCNLSEMWSWSGAAFTAVAPGFNAAVTGLVWVESLDGLITQSSDRNVDTWRRWDGAQWNDFAFTGAPPTNAQAFVDMPDGTARSQSSGRTGAEIYAYDGTEASVVFEPEGGGGEFVGMLAAATAGTPRTLSLLGDYFASTTTVGQWNGDRVETSEFTTIYRGGPELVFDPPSNEFLYFGGRDSSPVFIQFFTSIAVSTDGAPAQVGDGYFSTSLTTAWYEPSFGAPVAVGLRHTGSSDTTGTHGIHIFEWADSMNPGGSGAWVDCASSTVAPPAFCGGPLPGRVEIAAAHDVDAGMTVVHGGQRQDSTCAGAYDSAQGAWPWHCGDTWIWDGASWSEVTINDDEADGEPVARRTKLVFDRTRGVLLFGEPRSDARPTDVWRFDGDSWVREVFVDGLRDSTPEFSYAPTALWDGVREATLVTEGTVNGAGVWTLEGAHEERRPALEARFDATATAVPNVGTALQQLSVSAVAGGAGAPGGTATDGVVIELYNRASGLWQAVGSDAAASPGAPAPVEGSASASPADFLDDNDAVHVRVRPLPGTGPAPSLGEVRASLIRVTLELDLASAP